MYMCIYINTGIGMYVYTNIHTYIDRWTKKSHSHTQPYEKK